MSYTAAQKAAFAKMMAKKRGGASKPKPFRAVSAPGSYRNVARAPRPKPAAKKQYRSGAKSNAIGTGLGAALGAYLGGPPGMALGSAIGGGAQALFRSVTGMGAYDVSKNAVLRPEQVPLFKPMSNGSIMVAFREFMTDVISGPANTFNIETYEIQPGLGSSFPWLSEIADNFNEWQPHGIVYEYRSMSANALDSTNTALGQVIMATEYNPLNPVYASKQQMEQSYFSSSCQPSCSMMHPIECDPKQTRELFNTRNGSNIQGDIRLYDIGRFSIATNGMQGANVNCGELWVTYMIEFHKPKLESPSDQVDHYILNSNGATGAIGASFPLGGDPSRGGSLPVLSSTSSFGTTLMTNPGTTGPVDIILIPTTYTGNVCVIYTCSNTNPGGGNVAVTPPQINAGVSYYPGYGIGKPLNILSGGTTNITSQVSVSSNFVNVVAFFTITGGANIIIGGGTCPPCNLGDLFVMTYPDDATN